MAARSVVGGGLDWPALMRLGMGLPRLGGLGLAPAVFWALSPAELALMAGEGGQEAPLSRARLGELLAAYPDGARMERKGARDD